MRFTARIDDLSSIEVQNLVAEHLRGMHATSPPEYVHALALEALRGPGVTFWSIWDGSTLCGCAAMKELSPVAGEIKSMRTRSAYLRQGVGQYALDVITQTAQYRGYDQLLLETGTGDPFEPAHKLYLKNGFTWCGAFGDYAATHFNVFMSKNLDGERRIARSIPFMTADSIEYSDKRTLPLESILALYRANGWSSAARPELLQNALAGSHSVVTAWEGDKLLGLGNAISDGHLVVYYPHLLVLPEYQGRGIGKRLMHMLMARYDGFHQHMLVADGRAIDFYRKCGFERTGRNESMWIYAGDDH
jgi:putative acetyltransferase